MNYFQFLLTAKSICDKLNKAGYWADFINPFSGRPYLCPTSSNTLYEADERFRCLDFQIFEIKDCKIVSNEHNNGNKNFVGKIYKTIYILVTDCSFFAGSLFTSAPAKKDRLDNVFNNK